MSTLNETLIRLRKERGWSQEKLAAISGISERTIQRIERDGSCSLETQMALASAFEISPKALYNETDDNKTRDILIKTDWSGAIGLLALGIITPMIVLLTRTNGLWEMASFFMVLGLSLMISITSHGASKTYRLLDNTSWLVKYPSYVPNLNEYIAHAKIFIENTYIVGIVASLVTGLSLSIYAPDIFESIRKYITVSIKPLIYAILFVEFWFRPYKRKMEHMLSEQISENE